MEKVETIVIGAGVVGLAIARQLAAAGQEVLILEAMGAIGSVTTARNSGVIHAGIYYPPQSRKAFHCVRGRRMLMDYLQERQLPHALCGKLIVATEQAQTAKLDEIVARALASGVTELVRLDAAGVPAREPAVTGVAGLFSPVTGIVDVHELIHSYLGDAERDGAMLALHSPVRQVRPEEERFIVTVGGNAPTTLACRHLVNAAGLGAPGLTRHIDSYPHDKAPPLYLARGNYFALQGAQPFKHLVYPVPEPGGLGVHATLDMAGKVRFGPDVEWIETEDYAVNPARGAHFYAAIRRYWPGLPDGALQPDYAGIRPKTAPKGGADTDFIVQGVETHGVPRLVNLFGIESPGLTAALSLATEAAERLAA